MKSNDLQKEIIECICSLPSSLMLAQPHLRTAGAAPSTQNHRFWPSTRACCVDCLRKMVYDLCEKMPKCIQRSLPATLPEHTLLQPVKHLMQCTSMSNSSLSLSGLCKHLSQSKVTNLTAESLLSCKTVRCQKSCLGHPRVYSLLTKLM